MKVLNLQCARCHSFEGWFASEDDFLSQQGGGLIECPVCADKVITKMLAAPRLNLAGARDKHDPQSAEQWTPVEADLQAAWLQVARQIIANTEDVGDRFVQEARRIHYGETEARQIRGQTTREEAVALQEEGISVFSLPIPEGLKGSMH